MYCSSNAVWFPNEEAAFRKAFIDNNYFEWRRTKCSLANKEIFIRDVYKSWYVTGINQQINSIDLLIDFLKEEIGNAPLICIGVSSGAYMASIIGAILKADHVIAFSAQWSLNNSWCLEKNMFLKKYRNDSAVNKYYDIKQLVDRSSVPIYYIVPINNPEDLYQYNHIKDVSNIFPIVFTSKRHGVVVLKHSLQFLVSMKRDQLEFFYKQYKNKTISPISFSLRMVGVINTAKDITEIVVRKIKTIADDIFRLICG